MASLADQAATLAQSLTGVLNRTICDDANLRVVEGEGDRFFLGQIADIETPANSFDALP